MQTINFTFPVNELAAAIAAILAPSYKEATERQPEPIKGKEYLTRKETADILNVSLPTLNEYTKRSLVTGYRFGARVLYKQSDIEAALTKMNYRRDCHVL